MATTFEVDLQSQERAKQPRLLVYLESKDDQGYPVDCSLGLNPEVADWCERTECEVPQVAVLEWASDEEYPRRLELSFEDDAAAQLYRLRWLNKIESTKIT